MILQQNISFTAVDCKYKECNYGEWSTWSATCGVTARRTRSLKNSVDKVKQRFGGCAGLPQQCQNKETEDKQLQSCNCKSFFAIK